MDRPLQLLAISDVKPGMFISAVVEQNGPVKIRRVGMVKSADMLQGLKEMGVVKVEVDISQSLEIEAESVPLSQTQKLLNSQPKQQGDFDQHLSEQFNRSLFLPSIQSLPSAWQYYAKQVAISLLVVIGGLSLGWTAATYEKWLPSQATAIAAVEPQTQTSKSAPQAIAEAVPEASQQAIEQSTSIDVQPQERVLGYIPEQDKAEDESLVDNQSNDENQVSPELMRKFEQAIAALDAQPQSNQVAEPVVSEVTPVHKLPAWVLTELPSMSFSAHMYASTSSDRWLRVNGIEMREGDYIDNKVQIVRIEPQQVILTYKGQDFSMGALTDW